MQNLHYRFDRYYIGQIYGGDLAKIYRLLRIYELYRKKIGAVQIFFNLFAYSFGIYIKFEYQNPLFFYLFDSVDVKSYPERLEKSHLNLSENDFCCLGTLISKIITNFWHLVTLSTFIFGQNYLILYPSLGILTTVVTVL